MNEALWDDYELPNENQSVVKVLKSKGNNLHEASKLFFFNFNFIRIPEITQPESIFTYTPKQFAGVFCNLKKFIKTCNKF